MLKVKTRKGPNGEIEYYWEESESSSSSESSEIEDEDMKYIYNSSNKYGLGNKD